jgi:hypothetical protein
MRDAVLGSVTAVSLALLGGAITLRDLSAAGSPVSHAAEFVVTSPLDAGPGTLRDAILAADRLSGRARILIKVERISLESPLPTLINSHGIELDVAPHAGTIDAEHLQKGPVLQINSPNSVIRSLRLVQARDRGVSVNAPGVQLESLRISHSKIGILVNPDAGGCVVHAALLEDDEIGLMGTAGVRELRILGNIFRSNTRAGVWLVSPPASPAASETSADTLAFRENIRIVDSIFEKNGSGAVIANQPTLVQKVRFLGNRDYALLVLEGAAQVQDSEFRDSTGTAISISSGRDILLTRNSLIGNATSAVLIKDSKARIERNTLKDNGAGIIVVARRQGVSAVITDNLITGTNADAITLIGAAASLQRNQILNNHGAALRVLDLVDEHGRLHPDPQLRANVFKGNGSDQPVSGLYRLPSAL